jgi:predicted secreted protein
MAIHKGSEGVAKIGTSTIAEVKDWSISESADTIDTSSMGDTARTKVAGLTSASGSMTAMWDESDTTGQGAMTVGAEVELKLYPEGATTGDMFASLLAIITEKGVSTTLDGVVETSISFEANGAVTWAAVA